MPDSHDQIQSKSYRLAVEDVDFLLRDELRGTLRLESHDGLRAEVVFPA